MKNRCLLLDANHQLTIVMREIPKAKYGEVVVKIHANGICGSDVHFFEEGRLGNFVVTVPYIPGHEVSGTVSELGEGVDILNIGDRVVIEPGIPCGFCEQCKKGRYNLCPKVVFLSAPPIDGTLCDYIAVNSNFVYRIPDSLSLEDAALVEPAAVGVQAVRRARFEKGATGLFFGAGPIGLMTMQAFRAAGGGKVICVDIISSRLEIAKKLSADMTVNPSVDSVDLSDMADVVFETAGNAITTKQLFTVAKPGGCVVQVGWPNNNIVPMNIADMMDKELDYVSVNRYANAFPAAIRWLSDGRIQSKGFVTQKYSFNDAAAAFEYARDNKDQTIKVLIIN